MPEGPEIETERLHEAIHEEMEKEGGGFVKQIALTTAILAAFAAVAALKAGATVNEALVLKTEATRGKGIDELLAAIERHRARLQQHDGWQRMQRQRVHDRFCALLREHLFEQGMARLQASAGYGELVESLASRRVDPYTAASQAAAEVIRPAAAAGAGG